MIREVKLIVATVNALHLCLTLSSVAWYT